ncbi:MAG: hypothetical protein ACR2ID_07730 [Chthoniobacterales bacterium]
MNDAEFLAAFENCRITAAELGHREHLRLAFIYLSRNPFETALAKVETGLQALLAHLGAPPSKYHKTLTRAWLLAVQHFLLSSGRFTTAAEFLERNPQLLDQRILETHYTRERLWSEEARRRFIEPDLQPIPFHAD